MGKLNEAVVQAKTAHELEPFRSRFTATIFVVFTMQVGSKKRIAVVYAGLDERERALDWLEKSREERFNWLPFIQVDPVFKNLRSEARFVELCKSLGLE